MKLNVKLDKIDEELMYKRTILKIGDKQITTPIKAGFKKSPVSGINEIFKQFSLEKINKCNSDETFERKTNQEISYQKSNLHIFMHLDFLIKLLLPGHHRYKR